MRKPLNKKNLFLKDKTVNEFMRNGKKLTGEKILIKFVKSFQKRNRKNFKSLLQVAIINVTPVFSINTQIIKKGKRKYINEVPVFLQNHSARIRNSLKFFKHSTLKEKKTSHFYQLLSKEVLNSAKFDSLSIVEKNDLQKQVLKNKRYWANFKW